MTRGPLPRAALPLLLAAVALPLWLALVASLTPEARLFERAPWLPAEVTLAHYRAIAAERAFWAALRNSLVVAGSTTALAVLVAAPCAYALARLRFPGRRALTSTVLAVSMFPQVAAVSPLYLALRGLGLVDTYPGLVIPYLSFAVPLAVWLLRAYLAQLPPDLEDAARVDGATRLGALRLVVLPLAAPGVATTAMLTFLYCWNEFLFALSFTTDPARQTAPVAIALLRGQYQVSWGQVFAASVAATAPVAALVAVYQRRIVAGLTAGAVKG